MPTLSRFLLCLALAVSALAGEPYRHRETGITLPEEMAGVTRGAITPYGPPEERGEAIAYRRDDLEVTVFIRPVGDEQGLTSGTVVDQSLAAARELHKRGVYSDLKTVPVPSGTEAPGWCRAAFQAKVDGQEMVSLIYATVKGLFVVKVRFTSGHTGMKWIPPFMTEMQRLVAAATPSK